MSNIVGTPAFPSAIDDGVSLLTAKDQASAIVAVVVVPGATSIILQSGQGANLAPAGAVAFEDNGEVVYYGTNSGDVLSALQSPITGGHSAGVALKDYVFAQHHNGLVLAIANTQAAFSLVMVSVVWGTPTGESADTIEITGSVKDFVGQPLLSGLVDVRLRVSDAANDEEPSHTATINPAASPLGTFLSGNGTGTAVVRTNNSGQFRVAINEPGAGSRYLWVQGGGNARQWVRSFTGVQQLIFV